MSSSTDTSIDKKHFTNLENLDSGYYSLASNDSNENVLDKSYLSNSVNVINNGNSVVSKNISSKKIKSTSTSAVSLNRGLSNAKLANKVKELKSDKNNCLNEKLNPAALQLAEKIEYCMKFGYKITEVKAALKKLNYKSSKNDILDVLIKNTKQAATMKSLDVKSSKTLNSNNSANSSVLQETSYKNRPFNSLPAIKSTEFQKVTKNEKGPDSPITSTHSKEGIMSQEDDSCNLRPIVIDGSNVAMSHGNKKEFSCKGILLAVNYFRNRNHTDITVFVPNYRKETSRPDATIQDREILDELEADRILVYTPSRCINGKRVTCYDDRFILRLAQDTDGIIVSNDHFRDLQVEKSEWKELIEKRLLMYSFVNDRFMPPDDPLGRNGPGLSNFLRKRPTAEEMSKPQCPYGRKCTFGKKCKYFHPESSTAYKSVTDRLKEKSEKNKEPSNMAKSLANEVYQTTSGPRSLINEDPFDDSVSEQNLRSLPRNLKKTTEINKQQTEQLINSFNSQLHLQERGRHHQTTSQTNSSDNVVYQPPQIDTQRMHHSYPGGQQRLTTTDQRDCHSDGVRHRHQHITIHHQYHPPPSQQVAYQQVPQQAAYGLSHSPATHIIAHQHPTVYQSSPAYAYASDISYSRQHIHSQPIVYSSYPYAQHNTRSISMQSNHHSYQQQVTPNTYPQPIHIPPTMSNLNNPQDPRHNLFKNLCGLFSTPIVESVMLANPDVSEPKRLIPIIMKLSGDH